MVAAHLGVGRQRDPAAGRAPPERHRPDQLRVGSRLPDPGRAHPRPARDRHHRHPPGDHGAVPRRGAGQRVGGRRHGDQRHPPASGPVHRRGGGGRVRWRPDSQLPPPGQLQRRLRVLRRAGVGGAGHHRRLTPGAVGGHLGHHLLPAAGAAGQAVHLAQRLLEHRQRQLGHGRGLRALRLRRLHLRQAPRGHHRGPDHGQHPEDRRLLRPLPTGSDRPGPGRVRRAGHGHPRRTPIGPGNGSGASPSSGAPEVTSPADSPR